MDAVRIVNCTPHPIDIWDAEGTRILKTIPSCGPVARLAETNEPVGVVEGVPITRIAFGEPLDMPEPRPGVLYIVSELVKSAAPERDDLVIPTHLVRDADGHIVGCRSLGCGSCS